MWTRFTTGARRAVFFAQEEATRRGDSDVGPEHFLLALLRERDTAASFVLDRVGVTPEAIRAAVEKVVIKSEAPHPAHGMELKIEAKRAVDFAYAETLRLTQGSINTGHLLLGILREEGTAAQALQNIGVTLDAARLALQQSGSEGGFEDK